MVLRVFSCELKVSRVDVTFPFSNRKKFWKVGRKKKRPTFL